MADTLAMSLDDFHGVCLELAKRDESHADFVKFALTGIYGNEQVVVDPILNSMPDDEDFQVLRDYDSLIGIDKDIGINCALNVSVVAQLKDTLKKNIHLSHRFSCNTVSSVNANPLNLRLINISFNRVTSRLLSTKFPISALAIGLPATQYKSFFLGSIQKAVLHGFLSKK